jgi:hypothetical protein
VVEILETNFANNGQIASKANLDAWITTYKLPVTSVRDPDAKPLQTYNALGIRETIFIVDLGTMKIVKVINGSVLGVQPNAVRQAIPMIVTLLAQKGC